MERGVGANTVKGKNPNAIKIQMPEIMVLKVQTQFCWIFSLGKVQVECAWQKHVSVVIEIVLLFLEVAPGPSVKSKGNASVCFHDL